MAYVTHADDASSELRLTPQGALEARALSIFLFHNSYHAVFGDQKMSGLEIILDDRRIATNGDVRLSATPAQWDAIPRFKERKRGSLPNELIASLSYPDRGFNYQVDLRPETGGIPGVTVAEPDFPELMNDSPFLWYENEYLVDAATAFILAANCANVVAHEPVEKH